MNHFYGWLSNELIKHDITHLLPLFDNENIPLTFENINKKLRLHKLMRYSECIPDIFDYYNKTNTKLSLSFDLFQNVINIYKHVNIIKYQLKLTLSNHYVLKKILLGLCEYEEANKIKDFSSLQKMNIMNTRWALIEPQIKHLYVRSKL